MAPTTGHVPRQEQEPPEEAVREVAPGVLRLQLPVDMPGLGHVNAYALPDDRGAAVVDPGVPGPGSWRALVARLREAGLRVGDVHTVVITHSHPDHFGGAHRLAEEAGATVVTHGAWRSRWATDRADPCDLPDVDPGDVPAVNPWEEPPPWGGESFASGWRRQLAAAGPGGRPGDAARPGGQPSLHDTPEDRLEDWLPPEPDRGMADGDVLRLAGREWRCLYTPGHTLDHLCLLDPEAGVLLSGDHVLPTITPHISGIGSGRDPLAAFVTSLDRVAEIPDVDLVLPAHGHPFADLPGRVAAIKAHHEERLDHLCDLSGALGPATVVELSHELFRPARWGPMAESETYAHLEHLRLAGRAERHREGDELVYELEPRGRAAGAGPGPASEVTPAPR